MENELTELNFLVSDYSYLICFSIEDLSPPGDVDNKRGKVFDEIH